MASGDTFEITSYAPVGSGDTEEVTSYAPAPLSDTGEITDYVNSAVPPEGILTSLAPDPVQLGQTLHLYGYTLNLVLSVWVGGVSADFTIIDSGQVDCTVPPGAPLGLDEVYVIWDVGDFS